MPLHPKLRDHDIFALAEESPSISPSGRRPMIHVHGWRQLYPPIARLRGGGVLLQLDQELTS
ncbi:hypothetical protein N7448_010952 [Penicillium atrosanguineum]|nr:hypothetical protein N7448_010952 [Penicillium atrosanguineum]